MFSFVSMRPADLLSMDIANLDGKSENFSLGYYLDYLLEFPDDFIAVRAVHNPSANLSDLAYTVPVLGYIFGKLENKQYDCIHVSALSVGPPYRKMGIASELMRIIEMNGNFYGVFFADLYVRNSNNTAVEFYKRNGYETYRIVFRYYSEPDENALDMRKPLIKDINRISMQGGKNINVAFLWLN